MHEVFIQSGLDMIFQLEQQCRQKWCPWVRERGVISQAVYQATCDYIVAQSRGKTKHFDYGCGIYYKNKTNDPVLKTYDYLAYFSPVITNTFLEGRIVINRQDPSHPDKTYQNEINELLHEYGHWKSLIDWCIETNPVLTDDAALQTKSGYSHKIAEKYKDAENYDEYFINESRTIYMEEVYACKYALMTIDKLPISNVEKMVIAQYVKTRSIETLALYAKSIEKLLELEHKEKQK